MLGVKVIALCALVWLAHFWQLLLRVYVILLTPKRQRTSVSLMAWRHMHKVYCFVWWCVMGTCKMYAYCVHVQIQIQSHLNWSIIDLMHMASQKGAPACWGSNEALSRAPSPSMQPAGQPLHAIYCRAGARARALTERLRAPTLFQHNTCAQLIDKSWTPTWHCCYGDVTSMHKVYNT